MDPHLFLLAAPVVLGILTRLLRQPRRDPAEISRCVRDLISLRMVLRGTDPAQRIALVYAHQQWRAEARTPIRATSAESDSTL